MDNYVHTKAGMRIYRVAIQKKQIERQPLPYPSNCSHGENIDNFFTTTYSREACIQSCNLKKMLRLCGTVVDRWKQFAESELKLYESIRNKQTEKEIRHCLKRFLYFPNTTDLQCDCPFACKETRSDLSVNLGRESIYAYVFQFRHYPLETTLVKEIPDYPIEKFLADIGGLVGLLCGMSILSLLEIVITVLISIVVACTR